MIEIKQTETYRKWEYSLKDKIAKAIIAARLFRLANGLSGDTSPVDHGISELRIHYGPGYRIYFQHYKNNCLLLLCGGNRTSQNRDIKNAKKIAQKYQN